jgi:protein disulfide-isomerase A1
MNKLFLIALIAIIAAVVAAEVHVLNDSNFDSFIQSQDFTLVKFFAPWCGHCKALKVPYEEAATKLDGKAKIAEVDCTQEEAKALCEKQGVRGYPTLKFFGKDGSVQEYDDGRTADAIVGYILAATSPAVTFIKSAADLAEFKKGPMDLKLIINTAEGSELAKTVESVAKSLRKSTAIAIDTTVTDNKVVLHRTFDEPTVDLTAETVTGAVLTKFVNDNSLPVIGEIGPHNYKKYVDRNVPLVWIFVDYEDAAQVQAVEDIKAVAKQFQDKLAFAKLDGKKWAQHAKSFGIENSTPGIVIEDRTSKKKFAYKQSAITVADFKAFLEGFVAKTLEPIFKSEPIPTDNNGPLTVVVGKSYDDVVINSDKDVFVKFYAPWCGHCKSLAPKYDELAELFKDDANVVIAKVNSVENDTPMDISGFPTLYFYPKGAKGSPIRYNGDRETQAMADFITANRKTTPSEKKAGHEEL